MTDHESFRTRYPDLLGADERDDFALERLIADLEIIYPQVPYPPNLPERLLSALEDHVDQDTSTTVKTFSTPLPMMHLHAKRVRRTILLAVAAVVVLTLLGTALLHTTGASRFQQSQTARMSSSLSTEDALLLQQLLQNNATPASIRQLVQRNQFARFNLALSSGNVEIQKVYADHNNVVIGYTIDTSVLLEDIFCPPPPLYQRYWCREHPVCPLTIVASENQTLPCLGNMANLGTARKMPKRVAILAYYDTSSIQGNPQQLQLKILLSKKGSASGKAFSKMTVPFHPEKTVIAINQTVTSHGDALTLERVVVTPTEARFYDSALSSGSVDLNTRLSLGGKTYYPDDFNIKVNLFNGYVWAVSSRGRGDTLNFYSNLLGQTGTWRLTVMGEVVSHPNYHFDTWKFAFTVS